jgi:hypothetical protein
MRFGVERRPVSDDGDDGTETTGESARVGPDDTEQLDAAAREWAEPEPDDEEGVLRPEELDIASRDGVERTGEGRFVISTDEDAIDPDVPAVRVVDGHSDTDSETDTPEGTDDGNPLAAAEADLASLSAEHALSVVVRDGAETGSIQTAANDRHAALSAVLRWYADHVDPDAPPEATLRAVLAETTLELGIDGDDGE